MFSHVPLILEVPPGLKELHQEIKRVPTYSYEHLKCIVNKCWLYHLAWQGLLRGHKSSVTNFFLMFRLLEMVHVYKSHHITPAPSYYALSMLQLAITANDYFSPPIVKCVNCLSNINIYGKTAIRESLGSMAWSAEAVEVRMWASKYNIYYMMLTNNIHCYLPVPFLRNYI